VLSGLPNSLPSLVKAYRMQEKTAQVGFEWQNKEDVWAKVEEEIGEFQSVANTGNVDRIEDEFGDIMFSLVNYARYVGINPDGALERCNRKFKSRFEYIEANSTKPLSEMTLDEMDRLWEEAKGEKG